MIDRRALSSIDMNKNTYLWATPLLISLSQNASASVSATELLRTYGVVTINDVTMRNHGERGALVGGNLIFESGDPLFIFNTNSTIYGNDQFGVAVGGSVIGNNINVGQGSGLIGNISSNTLNPSSSGSSVITGSVNYNNFLSQSSFTANGNTFQGLGLGGQSIESVLVQSSVQYASLSSNSTFVDNTNSQNEASIFSATPQTLAVEGGINQEVAIFDVDAETLFSGSGGFELNSNGADVILINVTGSGTDGTISYNGNQNNNGFRNGFNGDDIEAQILWNFSDPAATDIEIDGTTFFGSILAPYSDIVTTATQEGTIAARSLDFDQELHQPLSNVFLPSIPEPSSSALILLANMGLMRRRRSH